jgi:hypothetical protein
LLLRTQFKPVGVVDKLVRKNGAYIEYRRFGHPICFGESILFNLFLFAAMSYRPQIFAFVFGAFAALAAPAAQAQVSINAQFDHPAWGPVAPAGAQYYYVPEIDGYYNLQARNYVVQRNGRWTTMATVPGYNTANFHPVVVDYRGREPWQQYRAHHDRYYRPVVVRERVVRRPMIVERVDRQGHMVAHRVR